jgi:ketosteroid isomerase-like protein
VTPILKIASIVMPPLLILAACGQRSEPSAASSAPASPPATSENVDQLLSKMEQDWVDALLKGDAAFQASLLADDYVGVAPDGRITNKAQSVEEIRSGTFKTESMSINGIKVRVFGDVAVVTYGQSEKSQFQGKDMSGRSLWTDIFVKRNGKWQIAANHGSRVDEPKKNKTLRRPNRARR